MPRKPVDTVQVGLRIQESLRRKLEREAQNHRVSLNRWSLVKRGGEWLIERRLTRVLGHDEALEVLRRP